MAMLLPLAGDAVNVSTKYRCHHLCHLQMSLGSGDGGREAPGVAQRPTGARNADG